jgi:hypothetical protein
MLRERVNVADFESRHFARQLVERLGWAVEDADQVERDATERTPERANGTGRVAAHRSARVLTTAS